MRPFIITCHGKKLPRCHTNCKYTIPENTKIISFSLDGEDALSQAIAPVLYYYNLYGNRYIKDLVNALNIYGSELINMNAEDFYDYMSYKYILEVLNTVRIVGKNKDGKQNLILFKHNPDPRNPTVINNLSLKNYDEIEICRFNTTLINSYSSYRNQEYNNTSHVVSNNYKKIININSLQIVKGEDPIFKTISNKITFLPKLEPSKEILDINKYRVTPGIFSIVIPFGIFLCSDASKFVDRSIEKIKNINESGELLSTYMKSILKVYGEDDSDSLNPENIIFLHACKAEESGEIYDRFQNIQYIPPTIGFSQQQLKFNFKNPKKSIKKSIKKNIKKNINLKKIR